MAMESKRIQLSGSRHGGIKSGHPHLDFHLKFHLDFHLPFKVI